MGGNTVRRCRASGVGGDELCPGTGQEDLSMRDARGTGSVLS